MESFIAVAVGGSVGAVCRYGVTLWAPRWPLSESFQLPLGVLIANLLGCLLFGLLKGAGDAAQFFGDTTRLFLFTGFFGAFTTFSTFSLEALQLFQSGHVAAALSYVLLSVVFGIAFVWLGYLITYRP